MTKQVKLQMPEQMLTCSAKEMQKQAQKYTLPFSRDAYNIPCLLSNKSTIKT